jgi:hypothetical protein
VAERAPRWRFRPYEALEAQRPQRGRTLEILLSGVSTRNYARVLPEIAESVSISLSAASREFIAASEDEFKALCERRLDGLEILTSNHMIDKPTSLTNRYGAGARPSGAARSLGFRSNPATTATARSKAADPKDRDLMAQRDHFQHQRGAGPKFSSGDGECSSCRHRHQGRLSAGDQNHR